MERCTKEMVQYQQGMPFMNLLTSKVLKMVLKVEHIAKSFGKNKVLVDVSFEMQPGSLYGIAGENGSGKSTLMKIIVGDWKSDKGKITLNSKVGYCPQQTLLFSHLTVNEHFCYFGAAYGMSEESIKERSGILMDFFNFSKFRKEQIATLSGGTQQKLNLSLALLHEPGLLVLDEPYMGFDWDTYLKFWDFAHHLKTAGCTILIVSHLITERIRFDRIFNLVNGQLE